MGRMTTPAHPDLALVTRALADESRASMVLALLDGRAWTAGELASHAGVARSTASAHVDQLVAAGLVSELRQGRHRYVRLRDAQVADAVEALAALSPRVRPATASLSGQRVDAALQAGRTCYRHLAGRLGVWLTDEWLRLEIVSDDWELTNVGRAWLDGVGVECPAAARRPLVRPCLDWTERREHVAGLAADGFAQHALDLGWLERRSHRRSVELTPAGCTALSASGLRVDEPTAGHLSSP